MNVTTVEKVSKYRKLRQSRKTNKEIVNLMDFKSIDALRYFLKKNNVDTKIHDICRNCGKEYLTGQISTYSCSKKCSNKFYDKNHRDKIRSCRFCDERFEVNQENKLFCSSRCKHNKEREERNWVSKDKRLTLNGKADWSITLQELINRDERVCHICNKEVDEEDYVITAKGYYICGNTYPSIDHVIPIAKGGLHRWGNIKLAHRLCNTKKGIEILK